MKLKTTLITLTLLIAGNLYAKPNCPENLQNILIIDLKSGWWKGDGGQFGEILIKDLEQACSTLKFEYRHSTYGTGGYGGFGGFGSGGFGGFGSFNNSDFNDMNQLDPSADGPNKFPKHDFDHYQQIWLLSGGEADSVDLRIESTEFKRYLKGMVESKANLFIGTGFGNVYHANALTNGLGLGQIFETDKVANIFPHWTKSGVKDNTRIDVTNNEHPLLEGISSIADDMHVGGHDVEADTILDNPNGDVQSIVKKSELTVLAEINKEERKFVLDSGMHRFYNIFPKDDMDTKKLLMNILVRLSK